MRADVCQKVEDVTNLLLDRRYLVHEHTARVRMRDHTPGRPSTNTEDGDDDDDFAPYRRTNDDEWDLGVERRAARDPAEQEAGRRKRLVALAERSGFDDTDFMGSTALLIDLDGPAHELSI
ncbi:hypothetical protein V8D89_011058 [Ganoderma adspersum]